MSQGHNNNHPSEEFQIFVNSRPRKATGPNISFIQVLQLSGIDTTNQDLSLYDVEWVHGDRAGTLTPGQTVELENGMRFDAGKSNRS